MQIVAFEDGDDGTGEVSKRGAGSLNGREKGVAENELFSLTSVIGTESLRVTDHLESDELPCQLGVAGVTGHQPAQSFHSIPSPCPQMLIALILFWSRFRSKNCHSEGGAQETTTGHKSLEGIELAVVWCSLAWHGGSTSNCFPS